MFKKNIGIVKFVLNGILIWTNIKVIYQVAIIILERLHQAFDDSKAAQFLLP